jgi:hypothetical protein
VRLSGSIKRGDDEASVLVPLSESEGDTALFVCSLVLDSTGLDSTEVESDSTLASGPKVEGGVSSAGRAGAAFEGE